MNDHPIKGTTQRHQRIECMGGLRTKVALLRDVVDDIDIDMPGNLRGFLRDLAEESGQLLDGLES